jgi:hypothetical protein
LAVASVVPPSLIPAAVSGPEAIDLPSGIDLVSDTGSSGAGLHFSARAYPTVTTTTVTRVFGAPMAGAGGPSATEGVRTIRRVQLDPRSKHNWPGAFFSTEQKTGPNVFGSFYLGASRVRPSLAE